LIEFSSKPAKGPEGKSDCAASIGGRSAFYEPPVGHPQSAAGVGEVSLEEITDSPATGEERYLPHDCKQDDFPFGPMKSQDILKKISSLPFNEFGDEAKKDRQREK